MKEKKLKRKIIELGPWFHQIEILPNIGTRDIAPAPGPQPLNHPADRWEVFENYLPEDMSGMRVLDMGCADGFFSIKLAERGAEVLSIDSGKKMISRLEWAKEQLELNNITTRVGTIEELGSKERFDVVFFLAVLYHLKNPLLGLERIAQVTDEVYLESAIDLGDKPYMYFKPPQPGVHNMHKWFPTISCIQEMMKFVGFDNIKTLTDPMPQRSMFIGKRSK